MISPVVAWMMRTSMSAMSRMMRVRVWVRPTALHDAPDPRPHLSIRAREGQRVVVGGWAVLDRTALGGISVWRSRPTNAGGALVGLLDATGQAKDAR